MEQGWDPEIKIFFKKILSTISFGLVWLIAVVSAGIYYKLGWQGDKPLIYVILFYIVAITSFFFLLRYYYRLWKK
jgi:hypothetical protein